jgi:rabenosyn-5
MSDVIPAYEAHRETPPPVASDEPMLVLQSTVNHSSSPSSDSTRSGPSSRSPSGSEQSTPLSTSPSRPSSALPPVITEELQPIVQDKPPVNAADAPAAAGLSSLSSSASSVPLSHSSPNPSPRPALNSLTSSRKGSTFRRLPLRTASSKSALPSSPLRPHSTHVRTPSGLSGTTRILDPQPVRTPDTTNRSLLPLAAPTPVTMEHSHPALPILNLPSTPITQGNQGYRPCTPASTSQRSTLATSPVMASPTALAPPGVPAASSISPTPSSSSTPALIDQHSSTPGLRNRTPAPYRPGFQPKGVYRPRTDEFLAARKHKGDVDRVERTRLERRLEKLINLHFPHPDKKRKQLSDRPAPAPVQNRRASSFFDIDLTSLTAKSAGDLWKGVVSAQAGGKNDIRGQY